MNCGKTNESSGTSVRLRGADTHVVELELCLDLVLLVVPAQLVQNGPAPSPLVAGRGYFLVQISVCICGRKTNNRDYVVLLPSLWFNTKNKHKQVAIACFACFACSACAARHRLSPPSAASRRASALLFVNYASLCQMNKRLTCLNREIPKCQRAAIFFQLSIHRRGRTNLADLTKLFSFFISFYLCCFLCLLNSGDSFCCRAENVVLRALKQS